MFVQAKLCTGLAHHFLYYFCYWLLIFVFNSIITSIARNSLLCADVPLRNYSLTLSKQCDQQWTDWYMTRFICKLKESEVGGRFSSDLHFLVNSCFHATSRLLQSLVLSYSSTTDPCCIFFSRICSRQLPPLTPSTYQFRSYPRSYYLKTNLPKIS